MVPNDRKTLHRGMRAFLLEASEAELREALSGSPETFDELVAESRAAARAALDHDRGATEDPDLHRTLCALIQLLRRRDSISLNELADRADVDVEEIRRLESDPQFDANPRTIFQLERYFKLKPRSLVILSGAVRVDATVRDEATRFAASSDGMAKLSRDEIKVLNKFVKFLAEHSDA